MGKNFFDEFSNSPSFTFQTDTYKYIIFGYPNWHAFIITNDNQFRIEVFPKINLFKKIIELPEEFYANPKLKENYLKLLSHTKKITSTFLEIITFEPNLIEIISTNIINEIIELPKEKSKKYLLNLLKIQKQKNKYHIPILKIENLNQISKINDEIKIFKTKNEFPLQPIPDNEYIQGLKSTKEINHWSLLQRNCIKDHINKVKKGKSYFYKINYNEEATLQIKIKKEDIIKGDLLRTDNTLVSSELQKMVNNYLSNYLSEIKN